MDIEFRAQFLRDEQNDSRKLGTKTISHFKHDTSLDISWELGLYIQSMPEKYIEVGTLEIYMFQY